MEEDMVLVVCAQVLVISAVAVGIGVLLLRKLVCRQRWKPRGRAVLITGCDSGIGLQLACHLDQLGFAVLAGVREPGGAGAEKLQSSTSVHTRLLQLDVSSEQSVTAALQTAGSTLQDAGQELWAVVNNAGVCVPGELPWLTWDQCQRQIEVNLTGAVRITRAALPLLQRGRGRVLFVTSSFTTGGLPGVGLLAATSAALDALADCLRLEAAGKVKVTCVRLGDFSLATGLLSNHSKDVAQMRRSLTDAAEVDRFSVYQDAVTSRGVTLSGGSAHLPAALLEHFEEALLARRPLRRYEVAEGAGARLRRWLRGCLPRELRDRLVMRSFHQQLPKVTHL